MKRIIILCGLLLHLSVASVLGAGIFNNPKFQGFDNDGNLLAGGCLYTYDVGTTTKSATCATATCSSNNTNPITLDARGEADIYGTKAYKFALYNADVSGTCSATPTTTLIWTKDNIHPQSDADTIYKVDSIAALRSYAGSATSIQPLGYYTPGDGGGGPVRVNLTAPVGGLTDNGGSIIKPGGAVGDAIAEGASYWGITATATVNVDSIAALRLLPASNAIVVRPSGYYAAGDGGGGPVRIWSASSTATDNGGSIIKPTAIGVGDPGRWLWEWSGPVPITWFGAATGLADNTTTIQAAINSGLPVYSPPGTFTYTTGLTIPAQKGIRGEGARAPVLRYTGNGVGITIGSTTALAYGNYIENLQILLTDTAATAIKINSTVGGSYENLYIEGVDATTKGLVIDGGTLSGFFNKFSNVVLNHIGTGVTVQSGVAGQTTSQVFTDVTCLGVTATGIGYDISANNGNGIVIIGGNLESLNTGIMLRESAGAIHVSGTRFEGNTTDISLGLYTTGSSFIGLKNLDTVVDNSGSGYGRHTFLGNIKTDASVYPNKLDGGITFTSSATGNTPLIIIGYSGQTADLLQVKNSSGTELFSLGPDGSVNTLGSLALSILTTAGGTPENRLTANPGSLCLETSAGKLYVKETGTGNTGWVVK